MKFVESNKWNATTTYTCTNEEPELFRSMLGGKRVGKAACIASGGEILLSVILPRSEEVVAVDHALGSCAHAMLKAELLCKLGAEEMQRILFSGTHDDMLPHIKEVWARLPAEVQAHIKLEKAAATSSFYYQSPALKNDWTTLRREWHYMNTAHLELARAKLDKLTVIHGDLTDAAAYGPFELLYCSNAVEHTNRNSKAPTLEEFGACLAPGGLLLATTGTGNPLKEGPTLRLQQKIQGIRSASWNYLIYEKLAPIAPLAPAV